jgi:hypothetical protein
VERKALLLKQENELDKTRISYARIVNRFCPEMVPQIIEGAYSLDDAYAEAHRKDVERFPSK